MRNSIEREGLVKQVDIMQQEKESMMTENIELKSQQEQLQTWIEEERNHNEILQSEIQKKVQEGFEIEEERVGMKKVSYVECIAGCCERDSTRAERLEGGIPNSSREVRDDGERK